MANFNVEILAVIGMQLEDQISCILLIWTTVELMSLSQSVDLFDAFWR